MNRPSDRASLNIFDQIDSICREYRALWKQGKRPRLEQWIDQVPEDAQPQLFLNLLQTEVAYRQRAKETPTSDDYLKRFPQFSRQVRQAFHEQSLMSMDEQQGSPRDFGDAGDVTHTMATSSARRLGDYELLRELGRGGMGVVYEARHFKTQNRVALKTLPSGMDGQDVNADRLHRFRREFRSLSEINHPNLVGMQSLEVDGTQWFFTMDLIEGVDYLDYVRSLGQLDETRLRSTLAQLVRGIMALHQRRIVHRDIKPSNVMVERDGTVKILDFGLVAELQQGTDLTQSRSTHFAGTPKYAAPEQMFGQRSEASDWYAVGVMLFEALNGQAPFTARDPMDLLRQKQTTDPPSLSGRTDLPVDLAVLADGLLKREPRERWTIATILEHLGLDSDTRLGGSSATAGSTDSHGSSVSGSDDLERAMLSDEEDIVLIGRERQLAQLEEARQDLLRTRKPVVVWISGLSGEGKSSLVEKFLRPLRKGSEMLVLSGRCYDRESVPFKAVDCLIEALVAYIKSVHGNWLQRQPPEDIEFLAQVFPLLRRIDWIAAREIHNLSRIEPDQIRGRAFHSFRQLLRMIGQRNPVAVLVDDLQWGDSDSAKVWHELLAQDESPVTLFLGSYRRDEADESPFLATWNNLNNAGYQHIESREVKVEPLSRADCIALAAARTGIDASMIEQQIADLLQESGGNPYFLDQLLDGFDPASGSFKHIPLDQIIAGRLSRLPSSAARLLEAIAVSGQPIRMEEAARVAEVKDHYLATITHMRSERLVRLMGDMKDLKVETYHDKIRETVLSGITSDRRKNLHLRMAETIESFEQLSAIELHAELQRLPIPGEYHKPVSHRVVDLANHFFAAGDSRAFVYLLLAAEQSMLSYAVEEAAAYYDRIPRLMPPNQPATMMFRIWMGAGRVYKWNKEIDKAIQAYQTAIANACTSIQFAQAHEGLSKVYLQLSRIDEGIIESKRALEYLHIRMPESSVGCMLAFLLESFSLLAVPSRWHQSKSSARQEIHRETFKVLGLGGGEAALVEKDMLAFIDGLMKSALAAVKTGEPKYKAIGFAIAAYTWSGIGVRWLGNVFLQRSFDIRSSFEDPELRGCRLAYSGISNVFAGNLEVAKKELSEA
nr:protein kinase [Pirellula sp.]